MTGMIAILLKEEKFISDHDMKQVINYPKTTGFKLGILVNFAPPP